MYFSGSCHDQSDISACIGDNARDYDNVKYPKSSNMHEIIASKFDNPAECIGVWIKELELIKKPFFDFDWDTFSKAQTIQVDNEEAFKIEDPYSEAINEEDIEHIEREDGEDESVGLKKGYSSVKLKSGFELSGQWRKGKREGPGLICGPALEERGIKAIWGRYKNGMLSGQGKASLMDGDCTLEGNFTNSKLHGPVRGLTSRGRFAWASLFLYGVPYGASWRCLEGGGFLYGSVGPKGLFSGSKNAYIYPDLSTALVGEFKDGKMVETKPVNLKAVFFEKFDSILRLRFSLPANGAFRYSYWPSSLYEVHVPPQQEDPYESKYVFAKKSQMSDYAGDGLFIKRDVPANTTIAFYNGIRVKPGDSAPYENTGYQIFVDWNKKSDRTESNAYTTNFVVTADYMDIPPDYVSLNRYRASLAHKINHSFDPNCRWGVINHPTFGRVPRVVTLKDLKAGDELSCHYMIDMEEAVQFSQWYVDLWEEFSKGTEKRMKSESMDIEDDTSSVSSV